MEWKFSRSALNRPQPQMKKRPGCSLPAGSFLFGWGNAKFGLHKNCAEAHAEGRYDIPEGDPAYQPELDKDQSGIACESRKPG